MYTVVMSLSASLMQTPVLLYTDLDWLGNDGLYDAAHVSRQGQYGM
jgi:hypothetical protein